MLLLNDSSWKMGLLGWSVNCETGILPVSEPSELAGRQFHIHIPSAAL